MSYEIIMGGWKSIHKVINEKNHSLFNINKKKIFIRLL